MALTVPVAEIVERSKNSLLGKHESWSRVLLGEIATIQNGFPFKSSQFTREEGMPLIRIRDVGADGSDTYYVGDYDPAFIVKAGDLLIGMDGDFNCARWRGPDGLLNQRVCRVILKSDIYHPKLLDYALPGYLKAINDLTSSVTVKHLSSKSIAEIPLPLPPMEQQKHIVAEIEKQFSRLDEAIANLKRVKANLKRYKAAVLKAAVEGRLVETEAERARREGRSYETGAQLLQRILETRRSQWQGKGKYKEPAAPDTTGLPELPEGWVWASVEQVSSLVEYGSSEKTSEDSTGIPVLRMGNIVGGELVFDVLKYLPTKHDEFPKLLLEPGDLLFNRTNSPELVGKTAVFAGSLQKFSFASYLIRVRVVEGVAPNFLAAYINSSHGRNWVKSVVTQQVGQANVNGTKLQALAVPLPPELEQHRIVAEAARHFSVIRATEAQIDRNHQRAERLRQALLSVAFSGGVSR
jgi:type I restriction enzyme, S subunit